MNDFNEPKKSSARAAAMARTWAARREWAANPMCCCGCGAKLTVAKDPEQQRLFAQGQRLNRLFPSSGFDVHLLGKLDKDGGGGTGSCGRHKPVRPCRLHPIVVDCRTAHLLKPAQEFRVERHRQNRTSATRRRRSGRYRVVENGAAPPTSTYIVKI